MCRTHKDSDVHQSSPRHQGAVDHQRPGVPARTRAWPARGPAVPVHALAVAAGRVRRAVRDGVHAVRSEEHTSELQSLMRISYAVFCLKKKKHTTNNTMS